MADADDRASRVRVGSLLAAAVFLAFVALRVPVVLSYQDTWYPFEVHAGTIARALLDGVDLDVAKLPIVPHARGCVLFGVLLTPLYAVLGTSAWVMKILPTIWNALAAAVLVKLLADHGRRRAATAAAVLFAIAPPMLVKLSTVAIASHLDSMLFFVLALALALRFVRAPSLALAAGFGGVVGAAGFFHLQALLPCLLVAAFLAPALFRDGIRSVAIAIVGCALGAAPSFCFSGGNAALLSASLGGSHSESEDRPADAPPPPLEKLADLARHDFAYALEYGELGDFGLAIGSAVSVAILVLLLIGAFADRRALVPWFRSPSNDRPAPLAWIFLLHAAGVVVLYAVSHARHQEEIAAGLTNRHLAPVFFSCLAGAALGIEALSRSPARGAILAAILAAPSATALRPISEVSQANRLWQRGECYEWFVAQLDPTIRGDAVRSIGWIESDDRGAAALRPLRFRLNLITPSPDDSSAVVTAARARQLKSLSPEARRYASVDLGRHVSRHVLAFDAEWSKSFAPLGDEDRAWALRGIGLGIEPPRLALREHSPEFEVRLKRLLRSAASEDAQHILEGLGFQLGSVFDPYNVNLRNRMGGLRFVAGPHALALWRGVGWGATCRYLATPESIPEDLVLLSFVPESCRAEFEAAFTLRRRP